MNYFFACEPLTDMIIFLYGSHLHGKSRTLVDEECNNNKIEQKIETYNTPSITLATSKWTRKTHIHIIHILTTTVADRGNQNTNTLHTYTVLKIKTIMLWFHSQKEKTLENWKHWQIDEVKRWIEKDGLSDFFEDVIIFAEVCNLLTHLNLLNSYYSKEINNYNKSSEFTNIACDAAERIQPVLQQQQTPSRGITQVRLLIFVSIWVPFLSKIAHCRFGDALCKCL